MSSRSRRNKAPTMASVPASVRAGLASLCEGNEHAVRQMLSLGTEHADLTPKLLECMGVNSLSAEMLLARFFDAQLLAEYCTQRLGKSAKGAAATLAERIAREWSKPSFVPLPLDPPSAGAAGAAGAAGVGKRDGGTGAADATLSKSAPPSEPHSAPKRQKGAAAAILPQHGHAHCRHAHRSTTLRRLLRVLLLAICRPELREKSFALLLADRANLRRVDLVERFRRVLSLLLKVLVVRLSPRVCRVDETLIPVEEAAPCQLAAALRISKLALLVEVVTMESFTESIEHVFKLVYREFARAISVDRVESELSS